jgi:hypothetical protein
VREINIIRTDEVHDNSVEVMGIYWYDKFCCYSVSSLDVENKYLLGLESQKNIIYYAIGKMACRTSDYNYELIFFS